MYYEYKYANYEYNYLAKKVVQPKSDQPDRFHRPCYPWEGWKTMYSTTDIC